MPTCPVCEYPGLEESARSPGGGGSYEICPSCGFQFGVDDDDKGITYDDWRARWSAKGMTWSSRGIPAPKSWDAKAQLAIVTKPPSSSKKLAAKTSAKNAKPAKKTMPSKSAKKSVRKKR